MKTALTVCTLVGVLIAPLAFSEDPGSEAASSVPASDLHAIIVQVSRRTHQKFLIDPRVRATVDLVGMDTREITYPLLLTILALHGYYAYEQDGVIVVAPEANERQSPTAILPPDNIRAADSDIVATVLPLKSVSASQMVPVLRPLMPQQAQLSAFFGRNALIIVDRAANVRRIVTIAERVDALPESTVPQPKPLEGKGE